MSGRRALDLSLYLVVGKADTAGRPLEAVVEAAVAGGVTVVQLREKGLGAEAVLPAARRLKALTDRLKVPLIVNDDLALTLAIGAAGLHLGQDDGDPRAAREALGPEPILGLSVGTEAELAASDLGPVDYVGIGPVFATGSKADAGAAIGLRGLADMRARIDRPAVAIGGIKASTAGAAIRTGVEGVAVVSAIAGAEDPRKAAAALAEAIRRGRA